MTESPSLIDQDWLSGPATIAVLEALMARGTAVRFVGGCVRDGLLKRPVRDVDIATPDPPQVVMELLSSAGLKAVPTGIDHGTITAIAEHRPFEITTLRRDVETDGRWARVEFTDDWEEDAARRDFTMNALSAEPDGTVHDYFDGLADLVSGRVRFVGEADRRIDEDVLRILRFYRFAAWYGRGPLDLEARGACRAAASRIGGLSVERVRDEMMKLLSAPHPAPTLRLMRDDHVLDQVIDLPIAVDRLDDLRAIDQTVDDPVVRLGVLIGQGEDPAVKDIAALARRLKFSNRLAGRLVSIVRLVRAGLPAPDADTDIRALVYREGAAVVTDAFLVHGALVGMKGSLVAQARQTAGAWTVPTLPVSGADVRALGVDEGPMIGEALRVAEAYWIETDFEAGRTDLLALLRDAVAGSSEPSS